MAAVPALWACTSHTLEAPTVVPQQTIAANIKQSVNRNVDIVFMIDNSSSMEASQANLIQNFPNFMNVLKGLPGGLPNVHMAVVTSDMGVPPSVGAGTIPGCSVTGGDNGQFQNAPTGACTATNLMNGATFISNVNGQANYTGDITTVFSCIAQVGAVGCGFEHQLASVARALGADGSPAPSQNDIQDFLRKDAFLAIIVITNEDDCSAPPNTHLFDAGQDDLEDQFGPDQNFRCNEFGHVCGDPPVAPPRINPTAPNVIGGTDPIDPNMPAAGVPPVCHTADGTSKMQLINISDFVTQINALKQDPADQVLVAAITGPAQPYIITWPTSQGETPPSAPANEGPWPVIQHSCIAADSSFADPGVRLTDWVKAYGDNGVESSICDSTFAPALTRIADLIGAHLTPPCIEGQIANKTDGTPDCSVVDHTDDANGNPQPDAVLQACAPGVNPNNPPPAGGPACWNLVAGNTVDGGAMCNGQTLQVVQPGNAAPPNAENTTVNCTVCTVPGQPGCM